MLLVSLLIVGALFVQQMQKSSPSAPAVTQAETQAQSAVAATNFQGMASTLQAWYVSNGTFAGATLPPAREWPSFTRTRPRTVSRRSAARQPPCTKPGRTAPLSPAPASTTPYTHLYRGTGGAQAQWILADGSLGPSFGLRGADRRRGRSDRDVVGIYGVGPGCRGDLLARSGRRYRDRVPARSARATRAATRVLVDPVDAHSRLRPRSDIDPAVVTAAPRGAPTQGEVAGRRARTRRCTA